MANRRIEVKRIATSEPTTFLDVAVSYDDAKNDFMGFGSRTRGYYLVVGVIKDENDGFIKFIIGRGGKGLLESAARFNAKRLQQLADAARAPENEALRLIVEKVLAKSGLSLPVEELACV